MIQDIEVSFLRDKKEQGTDLEGNSVAHEGRRAVAGLQQAQKAFARLCIFRISAQTVFVLFTAA